MGKLTKTHKKRKKEKRNSLALSLQINYTDQWPPIVGEVSDNFCG
jgi:hypothetical protein